MTTEEFNTKWNHFLEEGHYGMAIPIPEVIEYMDQEFEKYTKEHPEFLFVQIKAKFGTARVYTNADEMNPIWEAKLDEIFKEYEKTK